MDWKEISKKTAAELKELEQESRENLREMRFNLRAGKVKNVRGIRFAKRNIARILTALKQK